MISLILAAALANPCLTPPKVVHRKHHKAVHAPIATCLDKAPRVILFAAPEPDIEPVQITVVAKYEILTDSPAPNPVECNEVDWNYCGAGAVYFENAGYADFGISGSGGGGYVAVQASPIKPHGPIEPAHMPYYPVRAPYYPVPSAPPVSSVAAPEIGSGSAASALTLLAGVLLVARGRRLAGNGYE